MISSNTYEEVYQVLKQMDKVTVMKIPENILSNIINQRNSKFKTSIDKYNLFNENNISRDAMDILCCITYNYWMDDNEKQEIDKINMEYEEAKERKYDPNSLFKNNQLNYKEENESENQDNKLLVVEKKTFWKKIIDKIKKWLKK